MNIRDFDRNCHFMFTRSQNKTRGIETSTSNTWVLKRISLEVLNISFPSFNNLLKLFTTKVNQLAAAGRCASPSPRGKPHLVSICVFVNCVFVPHLIRTRGFVYCVLCICVFVPHLVSICEKHRGVWHFVLHFDFLWWFFCYRSVTYEEVIIPVAPMHYR